MLFRSWNIVSYSVGSGGGGSLGAGNIAFAIGNANNTSVTLDPTTVTISGTAYNAIKSFATPDAATLLNAQGFYSNTTGRYTPTVAGYYSVVVRINSGTDGYLIAAPFKNFYEATPVLLGTNINNVTNPLVTNQKNGSETSVVVYLNGTTDYVVAGVRSLSPLTTAVLNDSIYFSATLVSQQTISSTGNANYNLVATTSQTMTALLAAQSPVVTDVKNNKIGRAHV